MTSFAKTVEIGRVVYLAKGKQTGELAAIVDVIDQSRALIDGPKVNRRVASFQNLHLTQYKIKIQHSARHRTLVKAWDEAKIADQWKDSTWAKRIERDEKRSSMTDFDRYKLMRAKQARNKIVRLELGKLKRLSNKKVGSEKKPAKKDTKQAAKPAATTKLAPAAKEAKDTKKDSKKEAKK